MAKKAFKKKGQSQLVRGLSGQKFRVYVSEKDRESAELLYKTQKKELLQDLYDNPKKWLREVESVGAKTEYDKLRVTKKSSKKKQQ